jgi:hypothetical protein
MIREKKSSIERALEEKVIVTLNQKQAAEERALENLFKR